MQSYVVILQMEKSIKCLVTNLSDFDIIEAHKKVLDQEFPILQRTKIFDVSLFLSFLDKLSQFRVSFVTVSFDNRSSHSENKLPFRYYCKNQLSVIQELIETTNKLCALVASSCDSFQETKLKVTKNNCSKVFILKNVPLNSSDPIIEKFLFFIDDVYVYDKLEFQMIFPEFQIDCFEFPHVTLALDMFWFKVNQGHDSEKTIKQVNFFFNTYDHNENDHFMQISELTEDSDIARKKIVKNFIDKFCKKEQGAKIRSSNLYEKFVDFYKGDPITQTKFGTLVKGIPLMECNRDNRGVYFLNLAFKDS